MCTCDYAALLCFSKAVKLLVWLNIKPIYLYDVPLV